MVRSPSFSLPPDFSDPQPLMGGSGRSWRAQYRGVECVVRLANPGESRGSDQAWTELGGLAALEPHPGLARLLDHGEWEGQLWLAREWIEGESLAARSARGVSDKELAQLAVDLCSALESLHRAGLVHGDIKAENIVIRKDGTPVLTDLGTARLGGSIRETAGGTQFSMAPELVLGHELDARADVFSLGVMLAALLLPPPAISAEEFYVRFPRQAGFFEAADWSATGLPGWAAGLVERCVARSPGDRPQSALEVGAEIARRSKIAAPVNLGAFELKLGPRIGREEWFADFVDAAQARASGDSSTAITLLIQSSEPLAAFERELRLDTTLAGIATHSVRFEPRRLEDGAALNRFIERALPETGGHVFFVDREVEEGAEDSWRDAVLAELWRSAQDRAGVHLVRIARAQASQGAALPSWHSSVVPNIGLSALESFLRAKLENRDDDELLRRLAGSLAESGEGAWDRINSGLDVASARGWLAPGERAPHLYEARFEERLLPPISDEGLRLPADARVVLALLHAREGRPGARDLAAKLGVEEARQAEIETELVQASLVMRDGAKLLLTDRGRARAHATGNELSTSALHKVLAIEADTREAEGETAGEIWLLRLRSRQPDAALEIVEQAARTRERGAPARALDWLQRALSAESISEEERTLLLGEWCVTQAALGRPEEALEACRELENRGALRAASRTRARVYTLRRDFEAAQREWQKAATAPGATDREESEALFGEVRFLAESGRRTQLEERIAEMMEGRHGVLDPRQLRNARSLLAAVRLREGEFEAATEDLRRLLLDARESSDRALEAGVSLNLGTALRRGGGEAEKGEALELFESAARIHAEDGHLPGLAQARAALGGTLREAGRVAEAVTALRSALSIRERLGDARGAAGVRGMLGLALADRGEMAAAESELERAATELRIEHQQPRAARLFEARAELIRAQLGRRERYHFDPAEFDVRREDPRLALDLGRAAALRGRLNEAKAAWEAAREAAHMKNWPVSAAEARHLLVLMELSDEEAEREEDPIGDRVFGRDRRLITCLQDAKANRANSEEELLRLARELETGGRRDRAARAWYGLAKHSRNVERAEHARSSAEREFRACTRGLIEAEAQRLKKALLGIPDPCPEDLHEEARVIPGRREEELQALLDIQARLVDQEDLPSLLGSIVECSLEIVGGERGFLLLEEEGELVFDTALDSRRGEDIAAPEVEVSRSVIRRALEVGRPLRLSNATADPLLGAAPSVTALELRSILCTPFVVQPRLRGVIYLDHRLRTGAFGDRAEELLEHLAGQAALAIRQVRRVAEIRRLNEKLSRRVIDAEADLQSARRALEDAGLAAAQKSGLVGRSEGIRNVRSLLERAAPSRLPVLIQGQSGTGKELAARALHEQSGTRRSGPFVSESCAALPESLIESELFGYRRGAFTGAEEDRAGIFERAHGGTLFLDEIGELPLDLQAKLLRVLETGRVRRLGDAEELRVDFRLVAATNRDLEQEVAEGRFRADLRYRLDALRVQMPPLATRLEDVPLLVEHFLERESDQAEEDTKRRVSDSVMAALCRRPWPGNVRELANEVARLCVLSEGDLVDEELVRVPAPTAEGDPRSSGIEPLESLERRAILAAVEACGDDKRKAAKELGISRAKIYQKLKAWRARGLIEE